MPPFYLPNCPLRNKKPNKNSIKRCGVLAGSGFENLSEDNHKNNLNNELKNNY
jgi:hypothetical protein